MHFFHIIIHIPLLGLKFFFNLFFLLFLFIFFLSFYLELQNNNLDNLISGLMKSGLTRDG
jgi:hypothetical protein